MNIHINTPLEKVSSDIIIKVGSHMYNLNNEDSDTDYLTIYLESNEDLTSYLWEHHQLQYKENGVDYNYSSLKQFVRNILTGDATINFECLWSNEIKEKLPFFYENREKFISFSVIKSYLGLAKRDYKMLGKSKEEFNKKSTHFIRGVMFAEDLLEGNFNLTKGNELLKKVKNGKIFKSELIEINKEYFEKMNTLRKKLNEKFEKKEIRRYSDPKFLREIDEYIKNIYEHGERHKSIKDKVDLYHVLENGIEY